MSPRRVTSLLCAAEISGLAGVATVPSLIPFFMDRWSLGFAEAGWLSAVYFGAYVAAVPLLTGLTDRIDARRVMAAGLMVSAVTSIGFAWADGFWPALALRAVAGIGLAGVYMPGLKLLGDNTEGPRQSRYVAFYTASFSLGTSFSYLLAGELTQRWGWQSAFFTAGILSLAGAIATIGMAPMGQTPAPDRTIPLLVNYRPVVKRRASMAYILAYGAHMWELFSVRTWMVAFLVFCQGGDSATTAGPSPTQVVALMNLIGLPASVGGNELCRRCGREPTIRVLMYIAAALSIAVGLAAHFPYLWAVGLGLAYGAAVLSDSASLTAGALASAPSGQRGATLAVHSTVGFTAAFLGPLVVGGILDIPGLAPKQSWLAAFAVMGAAGLVGPWALGLSQKHSTK